MENTQSSYHLRVNMSDRQPSHVSTPLTGASTTPALSTSTNYTEKGEQDSPPSYHCHSHYIRSPPPPYFAPEQPQTLLSSYGHVCLPPSMSETDSTHTDWTEMQKKPWKTRLIWYLSSWKPVMRDGRVAFCGSFAFCAFIILVVLMITIVLPQQFRH